MKEAEVRIEFPNLTDEQREHLYKAEVQLMKAGVTFDTGTNLQSMVRDWEFDWSLKGARVVFKRFKTEDSDIPKT